MRLVFIKRPGLADAFTIHRFDLWANPMVDIFRQQCSGDNDGNREGDEIYITALKAVAMGNHLVGRL